LPKEEELQSKYAICAHSNLDFLGKVTELEKKWNIQKQEVASASMCIVLIHPNSTSSQFTKFEAFSQTRAPRKVDQAF